MIPYKLFIEKPEKISLNYFIPDHLKGISEIEEMKKVDYDEFLEIAKTGKLKKNGKFYEATPYFKDCLIHFVNSLD